MASFKSRATGEVWTLNGAARVDYSAGAAWAALPGSGGSYASTPDSAANSVVGDLDIRARVAADDWTPASAEELVTKSQGDPNRAFLFRLLAGGFLELLWYPLGTSASAIAADSNAVVPATDGAAIWVRATLDVDNGASGWTVTFYTSVDGISWTQLGATRTGSGVTAIADTTSQVEVGSRISGNSASLFAGRVYSAEVRSGIGGTVVASFNALDALSAAAASIATAGDLPTLSSFLSRATGERWSLVGAAVLEHSGADAWARIPGATSWLSTPSSAALQITGDIDIRVRLAADNWIPTTTPMSLVAKRVSASSYQLRITPGGTLTLVWTQAGVTQFISSSVVPSFTAGQVKWLRATLDVDNGAGGHTVTFYSSDDGVTWTPIGTPQTTAGIVAIDVSASVLEVGNAFSGASPLAGKFYAAEVRNGIGGPVVARFDALDSQPAAAATITAVPQASATITRVQ